MNHCDGQTSAVWYWEEGWERSNLQPKTSSEAETTRTISEDSIMPHLGHLHINYTWAGYSRQSILT